MRAHGAVPRCHSTPGEGTVVSFDLPAVSADQYPPPQAPAGAAAPSIVSASECRSSPPRSELTDAVHAADAAAAAAAALPQSPVDACDSLSASPWSDRGDVVASGPACKMSQGLGARAVPRPNSPRVKSKLLSQSAPASKTLCAGPPTHMHHARFAPMSSRQGSVCSDEPSMHSPAQVAPLTDVPFNALVPGASRGHNSLECGTMQTTSHSDNSVSLPSSIDLACDSHGPALAPAAGQGDVAGKAHSMHGHTAVKSPTAPTLRKVSDTWRRLLQTEPPVATSAHGLQSLVCMCGGGCSISSQLQNYSEGDNGKDSLQAAFFASLGFCQTCAGPDNPSGPWEDYPAASELVISPLALPDLGGRSAPLDPARAMGTQHSGPHVSTLDNVLDSAAEFARAGGNSCVRRQSVATWASQPRYSSDSAGVCLGSVRPSSREDGAAVMRDATRRDMQHTSNMALPSFAPLPHTAPMPLHALVHRPPARDASAGLDTDDGFTGAWSEEEEEEDQKEQKAGMALGAIAQAVIRAGADAKASPRGQQGTTPSPGGSTRTITGDSVSSCSDVWASAFVPQVSRAEVADVSAAAPAPPQERSSLDICLRRLRDQTEGQAACQSEERLEARPEVRLEVRPPSEPSAAATLSRLLVYPSTSSPRRSGKACRSFMSNPPPAAAPCAAPGSPCASEPAPAPPPQSGFPPTTMPRMKQRPSADAASTTAAVLPSFADVRRRGKSIDVSLLHRRRGGGGTHGCPAPPRILCVDDNAVNQLVISRMLQSAGLQVDQAMCGAEALRKLQAAGDDLPDLLIMDVMMPGISGLELCRCATPHSDLLCHSL